MNKEPGKKIGKRTVTLLAAVAVVAALAVGLAFLPKILKNSERQTEASSDVIMVYSIGDASVVSVKYGDRGKEAVTVLRKDGVWALQDDDTPVLQNAASAMIRMIYRVVAVNEITTLSREEVGLTEPSRTVVLTTTDGEVTFLFGDRTQVGGRVYLGFDGRIFVVDGFYYDAFSLTTEDLTKENKDAWYYNSDAADE